MLTLMVSLESDRAGERAAWVTAVREIVNGEDLGSRRGFGVRSFIVILPVLPCLLYPATAGNHGQTTPTRIPRCALSRHLAR
jgi:hypothetical protein